MSSPIAPDMVRHLKTVADPSLSPDGSRLAFGLSWVDRDTLEPRSRIMMMRLASDDLGGNYCLLCQRLAA